MAPTAPTQPGIMPQGVPQQAKSAMQDPLHPVAVQVGQAAAQGHMNPQEALARLAQESPDAATSMVQTMSQMDDQQRARATDATNALGSAAQTLMQAPQGARAAMLQQMAPQLAQHGIGPQQIQQALQSGLTDDYMHGIVGQALGTKGMIDQANEQHRLRNQDQEVSLRGRELDQQSKFQNYQMSKGEPVLPGTPIINPVTGQVIYNGDPGTSHGDTFSRMIGAESNGKQLTPSGQPVTSSKGAIGIAQVMPSTGPEAAAAAGVPWDAQKYRTDADYNAQIGRAYFQKLVTQFGGDETKAVAAYNAGAGRVQQAVAQNGDSWQQHMPKETQDYLTKVMSGSQSGSNGFEGQAKAIADGDAQPLTGRAAVTGIGARVMQRVYEINPGFDAKNYNPAVASLKSFTSGKDSQTVQALNNVTNHIAALRSLANAQGNGDIPAFNAAANWWSKQTGGAAPTNLDAARQIIAGEIVKSIAGAGGGEGDRQKAADAFAGQQSPNQINGALDTIQGLVGSQVHTLQNKYEQGTGRKDFGRLLSDVVRKGFNIGGTNNGSGVLASAAKPTVSNW